MSAVPSKLLLAQDIQKVLLVKRQQAQEIVEAFDDFVAKPLASNLRKLRGRDLARRNPMIYTARGITSFDEWADRVLEDWETSAIEGHIGTWMEEVARIVSGGFKPGGGIDLQRPKPGDPSVVEIYALQASPNTKSSGGSRSDLDGLRKSAAALRAGRRRVEMYVGVMRGRKKSTALRADPNITKLGSDDFWTRVSGVPDFRARLLLASSALSAMVSGRSATEVGRIKEEAAKLFSDAKGALRLDSLADPPAGRSSRR